jgi:hypothetical protein
VNLGGVLRILVVRADRVAGMARRTDRAWCIEVPQRVIEGSSRSVGG